MGVQIWWLYELISILSFSLSPSSESVHPSVCLSASLTSSFSFSRFHSLMFSSSHTLSCSLMLSHALSCPLVLSRALLCSLMLSHALSIFLPPLRLFVVWLRISSVYRCVASYPLLSVCRFVAQSLCVLFFQTSVSLSVSISLSLPLFSSVRGVLPEGDILPELCADFWTILCAHIIAPKS